MKRFERLIEVFEAPDSVAKTDFEDCLYQATAHGITHRGIRPKVFDSSGEEIGQVGSVYVHDETVAEQLRAIAADYHAMHDIFQERWRKTLAKADLVTESSGD